MLIINSEQIKQCVSPTDVLTAVENAFLLNETDHFIIPERMHIEKDGNVLLLMPAVSEEYFCTKLVSVFPENNKSGQPSIYGSLILNDGKTGKPLALLDGSMVTALRTGAVGALGIAYTTPRDVRSLGLIGAGVQGFHQILFACVVRNIQRIMIFDPYNKEIDSFTKRLSGLLPHITISIAKNVVELVRESEIIVTATTSHTPVLPEDKKVLRGKHFIAVGSFKPDMKELPDAVSILAKNIVVDTDHAKTESGDICIPLRDGLIENARIIRLGEIVNGSKRIETNETTLFKTVGVASFDLMTSKKIYEQAIEKGIGTEVEF